MKEVYNNGFYQVFDEKGRIRIESVNGGAVVVPVTAEGKYIVLKIYRPNLQKIMLEFPRGFLEPGEEPEAGARRELMEEIAGTGDEFISLGTATLDSGISGTANHFFLCRNASCDVTRLQEEEGIKELLFLGEEEMKACIRGGEIMDSFTIVGFAKALACAEDQLQY